MLPFYEDRWIRMGKRFLQAAFFLTTCLIVSITFGDIVRADKLNEDTVLTQDASFVDLEIPGNSTLDLAGHTLHVSGNLLVNGTLCMNGGTVVADDTVTICGTLNLSGGRFIANENVEVFCGSIVMNNPADTMEINGDFKYTGTYSTSDISEGLLTFRGNVTLNSPLYFSGNNTSILDKQGARVILYTSGHLIIPSGVSLDSDSYIWLFGVLDKDLEYSLPHFFFSGNLAGHTLKINGDLEAHGPITINGGKLIVNGDMTTDSRLYMNNPSDYVEVGGRFLTTCQDSTGQLTAGTLVLKGDFLASYQKSFVASSQHITRFAGTDQQIVIADYNSSHFNIVAQEPDSTMSDQSHFSVIGGIIGNACLVGSRVYFGGSLNGNELTVNGNLDIISNVNLNGGKLSVNGNANINSDLTMNGGSLIVSGSLEINKKVTMENNSDYILVAGNISIRHALDISAGTLEVKGNFDQYEEFLPKGDHTTIFSGINSQTVVFHNDLIGNFRNLEINNPEVTFSPLLTQIGYYYLKDAPLLSSAVITAGGNLSPSFSPDNTRYRIEAYCPAITLIVDSTDANAIIMIDITETRSKEIRPSEYRNTVVRVVVTVGSRSTLYCFDFYRLNHVVTFNSMYGNSIEKRVDYGEKLVQPQEIDREGYKLIGWYTDSSFTDLWDFNIGVTDDMVLYAKWQINSYTVTFDSQYGTPVEPVTVNYMNLIPVPPDPTRKNYTFGGWFTDPVNGTEWGLSYHTVTYDVTLYARWIHDPFTISFNSQGGSAVSSTTARHANSYRLETYPIPVRNGYTFLGWYRESGCIHSWLANDIVTSNMVLYAKWASIVPTGLKVNALSYNSITLSWTKVPNAYNYEVFYSTSTTGHPQSIYLASTNATEFTATKLVAGKTYYFWVRSNMGGENPFSNMSTYISAKPIPAAPASAKAAPVTYNSIKITWAAVAGATKYEVYRATSAAGSYKLVGTATATNYTNKSTGTGITYYYKVRAYRLAGGAKVYGSYSPVVTAKTGMAAPATIKAARASATSIKVTWAKVAGATKYELWRGTSVNGPYTLVRTTTSLSYTSTKLTTGVTYYYRVRCYHLEGSVKVYGGWTKVVQAKP